MRYEGPLDALPFAAIPVLFAALLACRRSARTADVQHVVARGHTIEAIAHRYHVTVKAIVDANHLKDARHLKIGETLTIPGVHGADAKGPALGPGRRRSAGPTASR